MSLRHWSEFPVTDIKNRPYHIYPKKGLVRIDGFKTFKLSDLYCINRSDGLKYLPDNLYTAISEAFNRKEV